ncbi:MAG: hemolysin III family protein [Syntrophomonas sp.]
MSLESKRNLNRIGQGNLQSPDVQSNCSKRTIFKDPVSGFTHLIGALLSIWGLVVLVIHVPEYAGARYTVAFSIFGASLILLYSASATYHLIVAPDKATMVLRRIDHMMIYVLIAGTYTPICLIALHGVWGTSLLIAIWILAFVGMILKLVWFNAPRWLSTLFYLLMGWLVVIAIIPLSRVISWAGTTYMVLGGLAYTVGAVIYATKWPPLKLRFFGFHEIFHLFVMLGSGLHFWMIFRYVMYV